MRPKRRRYRSIYIDGFWMTKLFLGLLLSLLGATAALPQAGLVGLSPCAAETLSVSAVSSNVQLSICGPVVYLYNIGSQEAFYNFGTASNTAAVTTNYSLPGNTLVKLNLGVGGLYLAGITAANTTTFRIVQGWETP